MTFQKGKIGKAEVIHSCSKVIQRLYRNLIDFITVGVLQDVVRWWEELGESISNP